MPEATKAVTPNGDTAVLKTPPEKTEVDLKKMQEKERSTRGALSLLAVVILAAAYLVAFCARLFAVIRFESIIHEFDPW